MSGRTPGGLLLPDEEALGFVKSAPWPRRCEEPSASTNGLRIDAGYLSPYFITDPERSTAELDDAFVLATGQAIRKPHELVPILESVARTGRAVLVIAPVIEDEALALLVLNKLRGILRVSALTAKDAESVARYVKCRAMSGPIERLVVDDLGTARRIRSGMKSTVIVRVD